MMRSFNMTMSYNLKDFVKRIIETKGGLVESTKEKERIDVLLPPTLQKKLSFKEYTPLSFSPNSPGKLVTYGSPVLDNIISLSEDIGTFTAVGIRGINSKKEGVSRLIDEKFQFINVKKIGPIFSQELTCSYLVINFKVSVISDERKEDLISVAVDEQSLRGFHNPAFLFSFPFTCEEEDPPRLLEGYPLTEVLGRAKTEAKVKVKRELQEFKESNLRRLRRDVERLWGYYQDLKKELRHRKQRKSASSEEKKGISSKIKAVDVEFQRKREDLKQKYSLKISLTPLSACRVYVPKTVTKYRVQRKSVKKEILLFWNPLFKNEEPMEPLICSACGKETSGVFLCNQLHLLCPDCHFSCPECGKKICKKCLPEKCSTCHFTFNKK